MRGWMYILECGNGLYYTGSTNNLELRLQQHQNGEGANFTKKHLPVKLVYSEEFQRIDEAFYREKQVQGWSRKKKEALINGFTEKLHKLSECKNETHYSNKGISASLNAREGNDAGVPFDSAQCTEAPLTERSRGEQPQQNAPRSLSEAETSNKNNSIDGK